MRLFRRKNATTDSDIDSYYASERRKRIGVAWLLGFVTLVLTVLLALAFFYGGRWVYRTVFDDDQPAPVSDQNNDAGQSVDESENTDSTTSEGAGQASDAESLPSSGPSELPSTGPSGPEELR